MDKFTHQVLILFGLMFCLNGHSFNKQMFLAVKSNTTGTLQCPDDKSINIKQIGFANNSCSSDAFLFPRNLRSLKSIKCYNRSTCNVPFRHSSYNFLNIGFQCIEEMCLAVKNDTNGTLQCPTDKNINIKQIGFANNNCSSDAFLFPQNLSRLTSITCNKSICTLPFRHTRYHFLNIGFQCKADNDTDRRLLNESDHDHDNNKYTSNHDNRNHTSDHDAGIQNHTINNNNNNNQTHTPDNNGGNQIHTTGHMNSIRTHTPDHDSGNQTHIPGHVNSISTHAPDKDISTRTHSLDHDSDNRTHYMGHDRGNSIHTTVFQTKNNPCTVCSTEEKCLIVHKDTENNIMCRNDKNINISKAWIDISDCNDIRFIGRNVLYKTQEVSSLCSGHSNCSIYFRSDVIGVLNILYYCNGQHLSLDRMNKSSNKQIIGGAIAGGIIAILIAFLLIGVFMIRRCRSKSYQESNIESDRKVIKKRSNPTYDPNEIQVDQEINHQSIQSVNSSHKPALYSMDTSYDYLQSKEYKGNNYNNGKDLNYTYKRDSSTYDHIQSKDGMRNQQTKTVGTDLYSHLKGSVPVFDSIYDHTLRDGIRDNYEGDYDVSHGIMTDDDYDTSGNFNQSRVEQSDSLYN